MTLPNPQSPPGPARTVRLLALHIEAGGVRHRIGRFWLPDGLHIWFGNRGVHLFWSKSRYTRRVIFDRIEDQ